jgi:hypothetical protein
MKLNSNALYRFLCKNQGLLLVLVLVLTCPKWSFGQEDAPGKSSIRTGLGLGINEGKREIGLALLYSIGWQKSVGEKNRIRLNPNIVYGGFRPVFISDTRDQYYKASSLGFNVHYDLIKFERASIVTSLGGFVNYSRGLLGTGGMDEEASTRSDYFHAVYFGGSASVGVRIESKNRKIAYEIRPYNFQYGTEGFVLSYFMFGMDIKLNSSSKN